MRNISKLISTVFYLGHIPRFQASITSLVGYFLFYFICIYANQVFFVYALYFFLLLLGCIAVYYLQPTDTDSHDSPKIVIDEFVAAALIPFLFGSNLLYGILALFLFRVIDILKPGLIKRIDKINHWSMIFIDDYLAIFAAVLLVLPVKFIIELI